MGRDWESTCVYCGEIAEVHNTVNSCMYDNAAKQRDLYKGLLKEVFEMQKEYYGDGISTHANLSRMSSNPEIKKLLSEDNNAD